MLRLLLVHTLRISDITAASAVAVSTGAVGKLSKAVKTSKVAVCLYPMPPVKIQTHDLEAVEKIMIFKTATGTKGRQMEGERNQRPARQKHPLRQPPQE